MSTRTSTTWLATLLLTAGLGLAAATPAAAAPGDFATGFEAADPQPTWPNTVDSSAGIGGYCCGLGGMESAPRAETAHTGTSALMFSGNDLSTTSSYSYNRIFDVDLPVTAASTLSYWIYPQSGGHLDVAVDLVFTDGSTLRDSGAVD